MIGIEGPSWNRQPDRIQPVQPVREVGDRPRQEPKQPDKQPESSREQKYDPETGLPLDTYEPSGDLPTDDSVESN